MELFVPPDSDDPDDVVFATAPAEDTPDAPVDVFAPAQRMPGQLPVETARRPLPPGSVSSRYKRKSGGGAWMIPMFFGLLLCGAVGWYVWQQYQTERLVGEFTAETAETLDLPPALIDRDQFKESPDEIQSILDGLQKSPIRIPSSLMLVQISANKRSVTIHLSSGPQTQFYRVDTQDNPALASYRKNHTLALETTRTDELEHATSRFIEDYKQVKSKAAGPSTLSEYRNTLALPALVRGLGHQVVAVYGSAPYRCVYEDRDGALYFLMPPGAKGFEITGRKFADGKVHFPGRYQVTVTGEMNAKPAPKPVEVPAEPEPPSKMDPADTSEPKESSMTKDN